MRKYASPMNPLTLVRKKRRRRSDRASFFVIVFVQSWTFIGAEDSSSSSSSSTQDQDVQPGEVYSKSHGLLTVEKYCRRKSVIVTSARLTCDSPGAYYYGSKTYRGSEVCIDGDKANLKVHLTISEDIDSSSSIYVQISTGVYDNYKQVISPTRLCQMQIQSSDGYNQKCPRPGEYVLQSHFYLPQLLRGNKDFHFTPDVNLTFTDENYKRLGCAVTGTAAMHRQAERRHKIGMFALGFALFVFGTVFGGLLFLAYRRRKRLESLTEKKAPRYQYFRTLPNGQVVPIQHGQQPGPPQQILPPPAAPYNMPPGPAQEAFQISNPAYNETQLPTRPVI